MSKLCIAGAALLAAVCYLNTLHHQFVFDDIEIIVHNPLVTGGGDLAGIFASHYWRHLAPAGNLYRPLTITTYALNHRLGGLDPAGYHLVNILLHALCSALVVALALRFGLPRGGALAAGLLFAAHPIHTEAVAGVVGRADLLAAAFVMSAWLVHLSRERASLARTATIVASFAAGLLSKENAIVLPALMLAGDLWRVRRGETSWRSVAPAHIACASAAILWLGLRAVLLSAGPTGPPHEGLFAHVPASHRIYTALTVMGRYLALLVTPIHLSADYSFDQIPLVTSPAHAMTVVMAGALVLLAAGGVLGLAFARAPRLDGLLAIVFLASIAPVSNLIVPIGTIMAERLLYLPSVAFCLALPALWREIGRPSPRVFGAGRLGAALVVVLTGLYVSRTIHRNADWKDQLTLFSVTTMTSPRSAKAHYNLGVALEDAGRPEVALEQYLLAVSIQPSDAKSHHNAGLLLAKSGRATEAALHLEEASRLEPTLPRVFSSLGAAWSSLGREREARSAFRQALERDPDDEVALYNLGTLALLGGRAADAIPLLEKARELTPSDPDTRYQLGLACLEAGRPRQAADEMRRALELPGGPPEAHLQLARALLRLGLKDEAAAEAARARALGLPLPPEVEDVLRR